MNAPTTDEKIGTKIRQIHTKGCVEYARGQFEAAHALFRDAYEMRNRCFGDAHPDTINSSFHAGKSLHCLGEPNHALKYYKICTRAIAAHVGVDEDSNDDRPLIVNHHLVNEDTIIMIQSIAWAFHRGKFHDHANAFYALALRTAEILFAGAGHHKIVARILNQWGNLRFECGDLASALTCYKAGFRIECVLEKMHLNLNLRQQKQIQEAEEDTEAPIASFDSLTTLSNIAGVLEKMGKLENASSYYGKIIKFYKLESVRASIPASTINRDVAHVLSKLARVQEKLGRSDLALNSLNQALQIQRREYDNTHHGSIATTLNEIGIIHGSLGRSSPALKCFEESLRIRRIVNDPDHSDLSPVLFNIARMHSGHGNQTDALIHFQEIIKYELSKQHKNRQNSLPVHVPVSKILFDAFEHASRIFLEDLDCPREALRCIEQGICIINDSYLCSVSSDQHSRFFGIAGKACLKLGDMNRSVHFLTKAIRVNVAGGLPYDANIEEVYRPGFEYELENDRLPCAPAA